MSKYFGLLLSVFVTVPCLEVGATTPGKRTQGEAGQQGHGMRICAIIKSGDTFVIGTRFSTTPQGIINDFWPHNYRLLRYESLEKAISAAQWRGTEFYDLLRQPCQKIIDCSQVSATNNVKNCTPVASTGNVGKPAAQAAIEANR